MSPRTIALRLECGGPDLADLAAHPLLASFGAAEAVTIRTTALDTEARLLREAGLLLRLDREPGADGERFVQTVEAATVGARSERRRWQREVHGPAVDRRALAGTPAATVLAEAGEPELAALVAAVIERDTRPIRYGASAMTVTLDRGRIETPRGDVPVCEAVIALTEGDPVDLFALAQALAETVPLRLGTRSIGERGEAAIEGRLHRPSKAERVALDPGADAGEAFSAIALSCLRHLRLNEPAFLDARDAEALHQIRVALRRLRSAFALFAPLFAQDAAARSLRDEIKRVTEPFGRARNLDVFLAETLAPEIARRPDEGGLHDLRARLGPERDAAYEAVRAILDSQAWRGLIIDLVAWIETGAWRGPAQTSERNRPAASFAGAVLERLRRRIRKRGRHLDRLDAEERHRVRILAKKLRYGAEFFAALFPTKKDRRRHKAFVSALSDLQDHLGALNDIATAHAIGDGLPTPAQPGGDPHAAPLFPAGLVAVDDDVRAASHLAAAAAAHAALIAAKAFWR